MGAASTELYGVTGQPTVAAVRQGSVGDCSFLAAVAAVVARDPATIRGLIHSDGMDSFFTVTFPKQVPVVVSRPTDAELGQFAHGDEYGFWVNVLEKAFGRIKGPDSLVPSEGADKGRRTAFGIEFLTGQPSETDFLDQTPRDEVALELTEAFAQGRIVTALIAKPLPGEKKPDNGLPSEHVYTVLGWDAAAEILSLRNPWGHGERNDDIDTDEDGLFEMELDTFLKYFATVAYEKGSGHVPAPPEPAGVHVVAPGDTLSALATRYYGIMRMYETLAHLNALPDPDQIEVGASLVVPRQYVPSTLVQAGDTLESLSLYWYGDVVHQSDIQAHNPRIDDPTSLPVGEVIWIPMVGAELAPL
jgi:LysM repeat protein